MQSYTNLHLRITQIKHVLFFVYQFTKNIYCIEEMED